MAYQVSADSLLSMINNYGGYSVTTRKNVTTTNSSAKSAREASEELRKSIRGLVNYDNSKVSDTILKGRMKSFVKSYNDLCENGAEVTADSFEKSMTKMKECVTDNLSDLKKVGISFNEKSKLEFDEDKFKLSTQAQRKKVFGDSDSFIGQIQKLGRDVYRKTDKQVSYTEAKDLTVSIIIDEKEYNQALATNVLNSGVNTLSSNEQYCLESDDHLNGLMKQYASIYNDFLSYDASKETYYTELIKKLQTNEKVQSDFAQLGISFGEDGSMNYDDTVIGAEDHTVENENTINAFEDLFGQDSDYKAMMNQYCGKAFNTLVGASTSGIIINEYA